MRGHADGRNDPGYAAAQRRAEQHKAGEDKDRTCTKQGEIGEDPNTP